MKRNTLLWFVLIAFSITGCQTSGNLVYFNDLSKLAAEELESPGNVPEYYLKPNDNLFIEIQSDNPVVNENFRITESDPRASSMNKFQNESGQYIYGYTIDEEGLVKLPLLGKINIEGRTVREAESQIQKVADEYITESTVKVKLLSFKVTVLGEVARPGEHNSYDRKMTILQAISKAGGITNYAKIAEVTVVRKTETGATSYPIDLTSKKLFSSDAYYLRPDDIVYVSPASSKNVSLNAQTASLLISTVSILIAVISAF